jgi:hypothetical protein
MSLGPTVSSRRTVDQGAYEARFGSRPPHPLEQLAHLDSHGGRDDEGPHRGLQELQALVVVVVGVEDGHQRPGVADDHDAGAVRRISSTRSARSGRPLCSMPAKGSRRRPT